MHIAIYLADWNMALAHLFEGDLEEAFCDAIDEKGSWVKELTPAFESQGCYCSVADAYEQLRGDLPEDVRQSADPFMRRLITRGQGCQELGDGGKVFPLSISPISAAKFAELGSQIDFQEFKDAFYVRCHDHEKAALAKCAGGNPEHSFEKAFLPYVEMWLKIVKTAAQENKCTLITWG
jgi:hypothetical protein